LLLRTLDGTQKDKENHDKNIRVHDEKLMDPDELDDWLRLFNLKDGD